MAEYQVRIDACFMYAVEADSAEEARANAESQFENGEYEDNRVTETLVFHADGVTIADDDDLVEANDGELCNGCGRDGMDCSRDPCPDVIADRGEEPETEEVDCGQCSGTGRTQSASNLEDEECPVCSGTGSITEEVE